MLNKVGFIGFGDMGLPMAKRVITHGYEVTICGHKRREPIETMKGLGAHEVKTPRDVAQASDVTIIMLRDDNDNGAVILGAGGVLEGAQEGTGIIMMSTLSPSFCRKVGDAAKEKNVEVLDAPVVGARMRAETGELGISVGGNKDAVEKYRALLETMGKIVYCGDLGMGEISKLVNNMIAWTNFLVASEAILWGINNGAPEDQLVNFVKMGSGNSWTLENWDFMKNSCAETPGFYNLGSKDLSYALKISHDIKQSCPLIALACELFKGPPPEIVTTGSEK